MERRAMERKEREGRWRGRVGLEKLPGPWGHVAVCGRLQGCKGGLEDEFSRFGNEFGTFFF